MADAFISYRRDPSAPQALLIQTKLQYVHQIDAYVDTTRTDSTRVKFPDRLMQAIADAPTFILLLGDTTLESEWVKKEIQRAYELQKHCIPVFQESYKPTHSDPAIDYVLSFDGVHLLDKKNIYIDVAIQQIADLVVKISEVQNFPISISQQSQIATPPKPKIILPQPFDWCYIPAGRVTLESGGYLNETKTVNVQAFWMAKYPITYAQYDGFIQAEDGYQNDFWWNYADGAKQWRKSKPLPLTTSYIEKDFPRTNVSWYDAIAFTRWLSSHSGLNIVLPNEAMWQRAAQGDTNFMYPWGNHIDKAYANYQTDKPTTVQAYPKNISPYGIQDMIGNVSEWTRTCFLDGDVPLETASDDKQYIWRGGSWRARTSDALKIQIRHSLKPTDNLDMRGFRISIE